MSALAPALPLFTHNTWTSSRDAAEPISPAIPLSIQRMLNLLEEQGEDDFGVIGPTQWAFKNALGRIVNATAIFGEDVPCAPAVDSEGGVRVTWRCGNKQIKLVCPAKSEAAIYLYYSSPEGDHLRNQNVTAAFLADRLAWLTSRESASAD